ncbi:MAG: hypothetical protein FWE95_05970 [Planctomycetaceae bacterium]|nr:hypothetical protein [Planctomycetaceae bacterium]
MFRSEFAIAVGFIALLAAAPFTISLQAEEVVDPCEALDPCELLVEDGTQFDQLFGEKIGKILNPNENEELDFENISPERILEAIRFLKDSEKLVAEAEPAVRQYYYFAIIELYVAAAHNTPDTTQADALYAEALKVIDNFLDDDEMDGDFVKEYKEAISFMRAHGVDAYKLEFGGEAQTIEEALTILDRERRDRALSSLVHNFLREGSPNFEEVLRANEKISNAGGGQRSLNYRVIAVRQFQLGQVDEAEKTLQLAGKDSAYWVETQLFFVLICDQTANVALARRYIDAIFAELQKSGGDRSGIYNIVNSFYRLRECLIQLKTPEIARHLVHSMVGLYEELEKEYQERMANSSASPFFGQTDDSRRRSGSETLANVLLHISEREEGLKYLRQFRELAIASGERTRTMNLYDRVKLIAIQYRYGLQEEAKKEIIDILAMIDAGGQRSTNGTETKSAMLRSFFDSLLQQEGLLSEAVRIARLIPDEKTRFEAYNSIVYRVDFCTPSRTESRTDLSSQLSLRPFPRFTSRQEVLAIAELLSDEPDGKSLESYRARIRQHAERMP